LRAPPDARPSDRTYRNVRHAEVVQMATR